MSYLFDASAIFKAIKEGKIEILSGNHTIELARYELGNVLWKEQTLHRKIQAKEAEKLAKTIKDIFKLLNVLNIACYEEEILALAIKANLTFYDASYVHLSLKRNLTLVTEDANLTNKAKNYVKTIKLESFPTD